MKFSTTIAFALFGITTQAFAIPSFAGKRANSPVTIIQADLASLQASVTGDLGDITTAIENSAGDANAQVQLITGINLDLTDIVNQVLKATKSVITTTAGSATTLSPVDVATLVTVLQDFQNIVATIQYSLQNGLTKLPSETQAAIASEIKAVQDALSDLQAPLSTYAAQVQSALSGTGVAGGLAGSVQSLLKSITGAVTGLLSNLGLGTPDTTTTTSSSSDPLSALLASLNLDLPKRTIPGLSTLSPSLIQQILAEVETLLTKLLGKTPVTSGKEKREPIPVNAGMSGLSPSLVQQIIAEVESVLKKLLGQTAIPSEKADRQKRETIPTIPTIPGLSDLSPDLIQQIIAEVETLLKGLLGPSTATSDKGKRQIPTLPTLPTTLPTGTDPTTIVSQLVTEIEQLLSKLLGGS